MESSTAARPVDPSAVDPAPTAPVEILTVCTGNICRSPYVEAVLQRHLDQRGIAARVRSAGTLGGDRPASDEIVELLGARGIDGRAHRSTELDADLLAASDLVLAMAREHVRAATLLRPDAFARTFTLKELVRRGTDVGARRADESLAHWLARVGEDRHPVQLLGASEEDDVVDPIGRRFKVFKQVATEIDEQSAALVALIWP